MVVVIVVVIVIVVLRHRRRTCVPWCRGKKVCVAHYEILNLTKLGRNREQVCINVDWKLDVSV